MLGVEYLYDQTGRVLQLIPDQSDDSGKSEEHDDEDDEFVDEGFIDVDALEDQTIAPFQIICDKLLPQIQQQEPVQGWYVLKLVNS